MDSSNLFALIVLFVPLVIGRAMTENALKNLEPETKADLLDATSGLRKYSLLAMLAALILIWSLPYLFLHVIMVYLPGIWLLYWLKLSKVELPVIYKNAFLA